MARKTVLVRAAAVAAACIWLSPPPVTAAAPARLTITGPGSGFVDVRLGEGTVVDLERATIRSSARSYVGVVLNRLGALADQDASLVVQFPSANPGGRPPLVLGHVQTGPDGSPLTPGTYRVYLLADGPATISFPVSGLRRDVTLRVAAPTTPRFRLTDVPTPLEPGIDGLYQGEARHPFDVDGHEITIYRMAAEFGVGPVEKHGAEACDTFAGRDCSGATGGGFALRRQQPEPDRWTITGYVPRDLWPSGTYDIYGTCYALQPVPTCRFVTLDRFVSTAPPRVALTIPETAASPAATPSARVRTTRRGSAGDGLPAPGLPATGLPGALGSVAALVATAALVARRHRRA